jgi:low affinity Fe/Cu permease
MGEPKRRPELFRRFAAAISSAVGSHWAFIVALLAVIIWAATGPLFDYSDHWQLIINTGTTVVTFLMVFVIQTTQNRDSKAIHLKLDELIRAQHKARNVFADLENASEEELKRFADEFKKLRKDDQDRSRVDDADDAVHRAMGPHDHSH